MRQGVPRSRRSCWRGHGRAEGNAQRLVKTADGHSLSTVMSESQTRARESQTSGDSFSFRRPQPRSGRRKPPRSPGSARASQKPRKGWARAARRTRRPNSGFLDYCLRATIFFNNACFFLLRGGAVEDFLWACPRDQKDGFDHLVMPIVEYEIGHHCNK